MLSFWPPVVSSCGKQAGGGQVVSLTRSGGEPSTVGSRQSPRGEGGGMESMGSVEPTNMVWPGSGEDRGWGEGGG